ncbi:hypothetical protein RF11_04452 [Thelohanellus kitauei]|uniref:ISXO2-like transposase domain-containing protein n=1 Tax=Thelohanellus kitauei TaxID=669202 RepID=A0A0C2N1G5_THEKT|nr:hypothetical protein RF11_04452 [Thelohanellus kitauei]
MGVLVLGGVERTIERKAFLTEVPDRTAETLERIISNHVLSESTIVTDCIRSYANLNHLYEHHTVNHSSDLIDLRSGAHTNTIEGTWNALKMKISSRNRINSYDEDGNVVKNHLEDFLGQSVWLREHSSDVWGGLLSEIKEIIFTYE